LREDAMPRGKLNHVSTLERPFALPLSEDTIQRAVFKHLRQHGAKGLVAWHPKNGGVHQKDIAQRIANESLGVLAGAPDVMALHNGKFYALELKVEGKEPTPEQLAVLRSITEAGRRCRLGGGAR
jgi:hypothetical protein